MNVLTEKFKEVLLSVLPIVAIVFVLHFTIAPMETSLLLRFVLGALFIAVGLSVFLLGTDIGITPIGSQLGKGAAKSNKVWIVILAGLALGFFISIAEPDLHILANQIAGVTGGIISNTSILIYVSIGIAVMLTIGLLRIVYNIPLYKLLTGIYFVIFILSLFTSNEFLSMAFDASGATTGALTVPFMLALALGVASLRKGGKASEKDSFGLVGIASSGAIIAVMLMNILGNQGEMTGSLEVDLEGTTSVIQPFIAHLPVVSKEIFIALLPILLVFLAYNFFFLKLSKKRLNKVLKGVLYVFIG
ncbi:MAG: DUF1538 domain-containing protein, partial [Carnobacterium sp.]|uniref:DUF1538 domain-containing protein n=1 Tax=Carnobacterium sp. TaxID=48221 RepID=UPI002FC9A817